MVNPYPGATAPVVSIADTVTLNVSPAFVAIGAEKVRRETCPVTVTPAVADVMFGADTVTVWSPAVTSRIAPVKVCVPASAAVNT